jgi:V/A-type H+-transporting ATPase subunit I
MAFAFNSILIPMVQGGNVGLLVFGWVLLVLAHMLVFVLGGLSSGIQSLRLNLVEFFMKFYTGGGVKFNPFGGEKISKSEESGA